VKYQKLNPEKANKEIVDWLHERWGLCVNPAVDLVMCLLLHKYGWKDLDLFHKFSTATMPEAFAHSIDKMIELLKTGPKKLSRRTAYRVSTTKLRKNDLLAIKIKQKFYTAFVHSIHI
jgi:hypothetical protein